jgi:lipopolysaccharide transport system permease protein
MGTQVEIEGGTSASNDPLPASPVSTLSLAEPTHIHSRPIKVIRPPSFSVRTLWSGLVTLTHYADLLYTLSLFRLTVRYKQSLLGWAWAVLQPLALMVIYTILFTRGTKVTTGGIPYPIFVLSALLPWILFASSITNAVAGLTSYPNLLTKMYFPREIIPFSYLGAALADFCIASSILAVLIIRYKIQLSWTVVYALPIVALLTIFAAGTALFFSAIHVRFRDVGLAMPFLLQVWMFTTPVVYSLQSVPARFRKFYLLDPVAGLVESFRAAVLSGKPPEPGILSYSAAITLVCFVCGYVYFKSSEATMADVI